MKGDISTPGKKGSVNLTEYDNNNHKIGSFTGKGIVESTGGLISLRIEGTFKNHDGQKNSFIMQLSKSVRVESFTETINGLLARKTINKVLHLQDGDNPYAIIVTKNRDIRMLKKMDAFSDQENAVNNAYPIYGTYDKDHIIVTDDCIIMRTPSYFAYRNGVDNYKHAETVKIIDLRGQTPTDVIIDGVVWNDAKWESDKMFYVIETENETTIKGYNQYGKIVSNITIPIFHTVITNSGIILGDTIGHDLDGNAELVNIAYDLDGNELNLEGDTVSE